MRKGRLKLVAPATVKRTVTPKRLPDRDLRTRKRLTEAEVERLMDAAKANRTGVGTPPWSFWPIGTAHGLPSLDFRTATLHVRSRAPLARTRFPGTSHEPFGGSSANRSQNRRSCLRQKGARHSRPPVSPGPPT
jgi:hypothetical protein